MTIKMEFSSTSSSATKLLGKDGAQSTEPASGSQPPTPKKMIAKPQRLLSTKLVGKAPGTPGGSSSVRSASMAVEVTSASSTPTQKDRSDVVSLVEAAFEKKHRIEREREEQRRLEEQKRKEREMQRPRFQNERGRSSGYRNTPDYGPSNTGDRGLMGSSEYSAPVVTWSAQELSTNREKERREWEEEKAKTDWMDLLNQTYIMSLFDDISRDDDPDVMAIREARAAVVLGESST
ncbi:hypothetical protein BJ742DRAFT_141031 [Cladochytrium replicatum]|nr:hypothetical protein BJ742DRAFT_141031 [Cladochytrium replicatum]